MMSDLFAGLLGELTFAWESNSITALYATLNVETRRRKAREKKAPTFLCTWKMWQGQIQ